MFCDAVELAVLGAGLMGTCIAGKIKSYVARLLVIVFSTAVIRLPANRRSIFCKYFK